MRAEIDYEALKPVQLLIATSLRVNVYAFWI